MKKLFLTALAVAMAALLAVGPAVAESNPQAAGKITVYGSATVSVAPDVVRVSLGVQEHADEVGLAQSQVNDKINAIVAALKEAGIADSDITTSDYMIYRDTQYDPQTGESKFVGYVASTNLTIKAREVDKAGSYIDMAVKAGANQLNGITFDREDRAQFIDKALELAVQDASRKAGVIAAASGAGLGAVISVDEADQTYDYRLYSSNVSYSAERDGAGTDLQSGTLDIQVKVAATYAIN